MSATASFPWARVLCAALTALGVRLLWLHNEGTPLTFPDEKRFWCEALQWAQGGLVGCDGILAHDMPATAITIGTAVRLFGPNLLAAKLTIIAASALTVFPTAALAWAICRRQTATILAAFGFAFYPFSIFYSALLLSETLFLLALTSLMFLICALADPGRYVASKRMVLGWGVCIGVTAGLAHLTRPTLMYLFPLAVFWIPLVLKRSWWIPSVAALCILVLTAPWLARNYQAFGHLVPGTLVAGRVLLEGNNPLNETGGALATNTGYLRQMPPGLNELERDQWQWERAFQHITADPSRFVHMAWRKARRFWNLVPNAARYRTPFYQWVSVASVGPIFLLAALFPLLAWSRWRQWLPMMALVGYLSALHMITIGSIRYRLPLEPILLALAASTAVLAVERWRSTRICKDHHGRLDT